MKMFYEFVREYAMKISNLKRKIEVINKRAGGII